jgi:uncharacterized protein (DUF4415 family)
MKPHHDFSHARRGPVIAAGGGKTRITIRLDDDVVAWFKAKAHAEGGGNYQSMINRALRRFVEGEEENLEATLRRVIREEMR